MLQNYMVKKKSFLYNIAVIFIGLFILLLGIRVVANLTRTVTASYINIIPLCISLWFIERNLSLNKLLGRKALLVFFIFIVLLTLFCIFFSIHYVFGSYLNGGGDLCAHPEQTWFYNNMLTIANFSKSDWSQGLLADMHLGKYEIQLTYASLLVRFGGDIPTNMCIWSAFHLSLCAFIMVLVAVKMGVTNRQRLCLIFFICLLQPYIDMLFACHRDGFGEAALVLGLYIYISTYKNNVANLIAFPFYAFFFWSFRAQYLLLAATLYLWTFLIGKRKTINVIIGVIITILLFIIFYSSVDLYDYVYNNSYLGDYEVVGARQGRSVINMILISILGYFPWTNLLNDILWPWQLFASLQGAMTMTILYYVVKIYKNSLSAFLFNPVLFAGLLFFISSVYIPGHMSYTVVAMPILAATIKNITQKQFCYTYAAMIGLVCVSGYLYSLL